MTTETIENAVLDFINAQTWVEAKWVLNEKQADLLSAEADTVFDSLQKNYAGDQRSADMIATRLELIATARDRGIDVAFAHLWTPEYERQLIAEYRDEGTSVARRDDVTWAINVFSGAHDDAETRANYQRLQEARRFRWAKAEHNEGERLRISQDGDISANIERAIHHFEQALSVFRPDNDSYSYGLAKNSLGAAYLSRKEGVLEENNQAGFEHVKEALPYLPRSLYPKHWAMANINLGGAYRRVGTDDPVEGYILAIAHTSMGLEEAEHFPEPAVASIQKQRDDWISTLKDDEVREAAIEAQTQLGNENYELTIGNRDTNLDLAIALYRDALDLTTEEMRHDRSYLHSALGVAYFERSTGNRNDNLEKALMHQSEVLNYCGTEERIEDWATAHFNLGNIFSSRIEGRRSDNMETAIEHYETALTVFTREKYPKDWAMVHNSLGNARAIRVKGDRASNIEAALSDLSRALDVYTRESHADEWAMTLHNIASLYIRRIEGKRRSNLLRAVRFLEDALNIRTRERMPYYWAMSQASLAAAHLELDNQQAAERHARLALEVYEREKHPSDWALASVSLAGALSGGGEPAAAVAHFNDALTVFTRESWPERWAATQNNLALAYRRLSRSGNDDALQKEREHLEAALEVLSPEQNVETYRSTIANLAGAYARSSNWQEALEACDKGIAAGADRLSNSYTEVGRLAEAGSTHRLFVGSAYYLYRLGRYNDSLARIEAGQARLLAERIGLRDADLSRLTPALAEKLAAARGKVRELEAEMRIDVSDIAPVDASTGSFHAFMASLQPDLETPDGKVYQMSIGDFRVAAAQVGLEPILQPMLMEARTEFHKLMQRAAEEDPEFFAAEFGHEDILEAIPGGGALVTFVIGGAGSMAWVIPDVIASVSEEHAVELADSTPQAVADLLLAEDGEGGYLDAYFDRLDSGPLEPWQQSIDQITQELWTALMQPVYERLQHLGVAAGAPVLLVLPGQLRLLPMHAAARIVGDDMRAFSADYVVRYAPSVRTYSLSMERLDGQMNTGLTVVTNPNGDLAHASVEGERVASHFGDEERLELTGNAATDTAVIEAIDGRAYLHIACHGVYNWVDVMDSHLELADESTLKLSRILSDDVNLSGSRLVFLSACETGIIEFERAASENLGIHTGFLLGGAPAVISTLWRVDDVSTALLASEFYRLHIEQGEDPATALQGAQKWLATSTAKELGLARMWESVYRSKAAAERDQNAYRHMRHHDANPDAIPYASPYYWAGFVLTGS